MEQSHRLKRTNAPVRVYNKPLSPEEQSSCSAAGTSLRGPGTRSHAQGSSSRGTHVVDVVLRGSVGQTSHVDAVAGGALEGGRSVAVPVVRHPCGEKSPF